jgi:LmbE family N-acetylglucosaminyl deacetylase
MALQCADYKRGDMTKTILAVLAHPDDESFGLGGTLALYARRGCDTV